MPNNSNTIQFPTKKPHISYSEVRIWKECPWKHKLTYIDKIDLFKPSPFLDFGTAVHEGCESIINGEPIDREGLCEGIRSAWEKNGFDDQDWVSKQPGWYKYHHHDTWISWANSMWDHIPGFLDDTFPGWEPIKAEAELYENIDNDNIKFKGFIDAIIKAPKKRGKGHEYWILDWKTANAYGWRREKKQDILMTAQLILYKHFWSKKLGIPLDEVRCGFILLKRGGKPGKVCELVKVSAGPKALEKATKIVRSMLTMVRKEFYIKNRNSCTYCPYKDTEHCT